MTTDKCQVTVKAGPSHSRGYESFVSNTLKDEVLKEITSNLPEDLKKEALNTFVENIKAGRTIKDCVFKVQNDVLPKVPTERNKFYIKFTYENQLQIEIGVNKFKNGNAQFFHKIDVAPRDEPRANQELHHDDDDHEKVVDKQHDAMKELRSSFPRKSLKSQTTNDRSQPSAAGKVSKPGGGWEDISNYKIAPNPTNKQTIRELGGWTPNTQDVETKFFARKPGKSSVKVRSQSAGRPVTRRDPTTRFGRFRGALGDCFQTGIRPSQDNLHATDSTSFKTSPTIRRSSWSRRSNSPGVKIPIIINTVKDDSIEMEEVDEEWDENDCEELKDPHVSDTGYVSCEERDQIFLTKPRILKKSMKPSSEYPIKNLIRCNYSSSSNHVEDGWHGPVVQRTREAPRKYFGKLEISENNDSALFNETFRKNGFANQEGWIEIPVKRL